MKLTIPSRQAPRQFLQNYIVICDPPLEIRSLSHQCGHVPGRPWSRSLLALTSEPASGSVRKNRNMKAVAPGKYFSFRLVVTEKRYRTGP
jgi:hypothetical protein